MTVMDDPLARQSDVERRAGRYEGERRTSTVPELGVDETLTSGGGAGVKRRKVSARDKGRAQEALAESPLFNTGEGSANPEEWSISRRVEPATDASRIAGRAPETMKERKFGERGISPKPRCWRDRTNPRLTRWVRMPKGPSPAANRNRHAPRQTFAPSSQARRSSLRKGKNLNAGASAAGL